MKKFRRSARSGRWMVAAWTGALLAIALLASPAAAVAVPARRPVPLTGTSTFNVASPTPCALIHQTYDATLGKRGRAGSLHIDGCATLEDPFSGTGPATFDGTFTLTAPRGRTIRGTTSGFIADQPTPPGACAPLNAASFEFVLAPTSRHTHGYYSVVGIWCSAGQLVPGAISGTMTFVQ